jgi:hypothetical protein
VTNFATAFHLSVTFAEVSSDAWQHNRRVTFAANKRVIPAPQLKGRIR